MSEDYRMGLLRAATGREKCREGQKRKRDLGDELRDGHRVCTTGCRGPGGARGKR